MVQRKRRQRRPNKAKRFLRKSATALFYAGCGYAVYKSKANSYDARAQAAELSLAKSKVCSDLLDNYVKSCGKSKEEGCATARDAKELKDEFREILKSHSVPFSRECISLPRDGGRDPVAVKCRPGDGNAHELKGKVFLWNSKSHSKPQESKELAIDSIDCSLNTSAISANCKAISAGRTETLIKEMASSLSFFTSALVLLFIAKRLRQVIPSVLAKRKRRTMETKMEAAPSQRADPAPAPREPVIESSTGERRPFQTPRPKRVKKTKADLVAELDSVLYAKFGLVGFANAMASHISKKELKKYIREPRSLYYWVRDNRPRVADGKYDPDSLMGTLRDKPSGEFAAVTEQRKNPSQEINHEEILDVINFDNGARSDFEKLEQPLRKSLLKALWNYRMESGVARTYSGLKGVLGLNFAKGCRVLFHESGGNINVLLVATDHAVYERWLDNARRGRVPALKLVYD